MAVHELGHVLSAWLGGADVVSVELRPWALSHTIIANSDAPMRDVWLGPIVGVVLPVVLYGLAWRRPRLGPALGFFAGFCCVANGVYLGVGWIGPYGDTKTLIDLGSGVAPMFGFGLVSCGMGFFLWHRLGNCAEECEPS